MTSEEDEGLEPIDKFKTKRDLSPNMMHEINNILKRITVTNKNHQLHKFKTKNGFRKYSKSPSRAELENL